MWDGVDSAGTRRRQPGRRRLGKNGEGGRMKSGGKRKEEGRQQVGRGLQLGGSGWRSSEQGWGLYLEMREPAFVGEKRAKRKSCRFH